MEFEFIFLFLFILFMLIVAGVIFEWPINKHKTASANEQIHEINKLEDKTTDGLPEIKLGCLCKKCLTENMSLIQTCERCPKMEENSYEKHRIRNIKIYKGIFNAQSRTGQCVGAGKTFSKRTNIKN